MIFLPYFEYRWKVVVKMLKSHVIVTLREVFGILGIILRAVDNCRENNTEHSIWDHFARRTAIKTFRGFNLSRVFAIIRRFGISGFFKDNLKVFPESIF